MNPPFSRGFIKKAVAKAVEQVKTAKIVAAILPATMEAPWFHEHILNVADRVVFFTPRVHYYDTEGNPQKGCTFASMGVFWRPGPKRITAFESVNTRVILREYSKCENRNV